MRRKSMSKFARVVFVGGLAVLCVEVARAADRAGPLKKVVLIAGTKSHGPGEHEYERGLKLLKQCLETAPNVKGVKAEIHEGGWPANPRTLDDADTIVMFCDGSDRDPNAHPLLRDDRLATIEKLMNRGVGFVAIHYTVFVPKSTGGERFLDWIGGYFDYESGTASNHWYSKIRTAATRPVPAMLDHPICRGLSPFELREEYYYNIRFRPGDTRLVPILKTSIPDEAEPQVVAWAVERSDGGRGFGFTGGHFHANWGVENLRKMMLNAILWTAHCEVPAGGVVSTVPPQGR